MKKISKIAALAVALAIVLAAFVVALDQGPLSTGSADTGEEDNLPSGDAPLKGDEDPSGELPDESKDPVETGPSSTTLSVSKTAAGFWEKKTIYNWDLEKRMIGDTAEMQVEPGEKVKLAYVIDVDRSVCTEETFGVRGTISVTNTGDCPTECLSISDIVQIWNGCEWEDLVVVSVDVSAKPVLQAGECFTYCYEVLLDGLYIDCELRNAADVTITNLVGHEGCAFGVQACVEFDMPCEKECIVVDDVAVLTDYFSIPAGFAAKPLHGTNVGPWVLGGDDCMEWSICVKFLLENREAPRYGTYCIANEATLVTCDTGKCLSSRVPLTITTGQDETTLLVEKTAAVTGWTEYIRYEADPQSFIYIGSAETMDEDMYEPVLVEMDCTDYVHTLTVSGTILVINTGCYPTDGMRIIDTIQMLNIGPGYEGDPLEGDCWVDIASIEVDTSCKPMVFPGEWYHYSYEITFTVDDLELAGLVNLQFRNQAYVSICNYDDDKGIDGVYAYAPLCLPLRPDMITVETCADMESCDAIPFGDHLDINVQASFHYRQLMVVTNTDERSTIDVCTEMSFNGGVWINDDVCGAEHFDLAISLSSSKSASGEVRCIELVSEDHVDDLGAISFCLFGQEMEAGIYASLDYLESQELCLDGGSFLLAEGKMAIGMLLIDFCA